MAQNEGNREISVSARHGQQASPLNDTARLPIVFGDGEMASGSGRRMSCGPDPAKAWELEWETRWRFGSTNSRPGAGDQQRSGCANFFADRVQQRRETGAGNRSQHLSDAVPLVKVPLTGTTSLLGRHRQSCRHLAPTFHFLRSRSSCSSFKTAGRDGRTSGRQFVLTRPSACLASKQST